MYGSVRSHTHFLIIRVISVFMYFSHMASKRLFLRKGLGAELAGKRAFWLLSGGCSSSGYIEYSGRLLYCIMIHKTFRRIIVSFLFFTKNDIFFRIDCSNERLLHKIINKISLIWNFMEWKSKSLHLSFRQFLWAWATLTLTWDFIGNFIFRIS